MSTQELQNPSMGIAEGVAISATKLRTVSIKAYVAERGYARISSTVLETVNNIPYIMFTTSEGVSDVVCFSKRTAEGVSVGTPVTKELLGSLDIGFTTNASGEERVKLVTKGGMDIAGLLD